MTKLICTIFALTLACTSIAQTTTSKAKIDATCDNFMQLVRDGKNAEAMLVLKNNTVIPGETIDKFLSTIEGHMVIVLANYGKIIGYEFVQEKKIKDVISKRFYILKLEKFYMKFDFTLYNGAAGWTVINFNYNEELAELLQ